MATSDSLARKNVVDSAPVPHQKILGRHWLIELYGCPAAKLSDISFIETTLRESAKLAKAVVVETCFHKFSPYGVSGFVVITESHLAIHTWPEHNYAAVDFFTCGPQVDMNRAYNHLVQEFTPSSNSKSEICRGLLIENQTS